MKYGIIYRATNKINGKCYIGQTVKPLYKRIKQHVSYALREGNSFFHNALLKYGENNFEWDEIDCAELNKYELDFLEKYWISYYNSNNSYHGYNMTKGGDGVTKGTIPWNKGLTYKGLLHSEKQKKKWSIERKGSIGYPRSEKEKKRMRENNPSSRPEIRKKISSSQKKRFEDGVYLSKEARRKLGDPARKRRWITKGQEEKYVFIKEVNNYLDKGWKKGRKPSLSKTISTNNKGKAFKDYVWVHCFNNIDGLVRSRVKKDKLELYIKKGWVLGFK